jgi:uncharacterized membrane protein YkgB
LNFVNDVTSGETISTVVGSAWNIAVQQGTDTNATAHIIGAAAIVIPDGATSLIATTQRISGLLPGVVYSVQAVVTTSLGNTKSLWAHVFGEAVD